jgi:hypothetical protein
MSFDRTTMSWFAIALALAVALGLSMGCERDDGTKAVSAAKEAASEAAEAAQEAAGEAAAAAGELAEEAAVAAGEAVDAAAEAAEDAAAALTGPAAISRCKELAAKEAWADALGACTQARAAAPDDMAIEHALQQAQAAAKAGS